MHPSLPLRRACKLCERFECSAHAHSLRSQVAILQLASWSACLVLRVAGATCLPPALAALLADPDVIKVRMMMSMRMMMFIMMMMSLIRPVSSPAPGRTPFWKGS
jgi:hypothetical protein